MITEVITIVMYEVVPKYIEIYINIISQRAYVFRIKYFIMSGIAELL